MMALKREDPACYVRESLPLSEVEGYLRLMRNMGKLMYQRNNTGAIRDKSNRPVRFGEPGSPDFYVFLPRGKTLHLEVKRPIGGRLSSNQRLWQDAMSRLGHDYRVVTSGEEAQQIIEQFLSRQDEPLPALGAVSRHQ